MKQVQLLCLIFLSILSAPSSAFAANVCQVGSVEADQLLKKILAGQEEDVAAEKAAANAETQSQKRRLQAGVDRYRAHKEGIASDNLNQYFAANPHVKDAIPDSVRSQVFDSASLQRVFTQSTDPGVAKVINESLVPALQASSDEDKAVLLAILAQKGSAKAEDLSATISRFKLAQSGDVIHAADATRAGIMDLDGQLKALEPLITGNKNVDPDELAEIISRLKQPKSGASPNQLLTIQKYEALSQQRGALSFEKDLLEKRGSIKITRVTDSNYKNMVEARVNGGNAHAVADSTVTEIEVKEPFSICRGATGGGGAVGSFFFGCASTTYGTPSDLRRKLATPLQANDGFVFKYDLSAGDKLEIDATGPLYKYKYRGDRTGGATGGAVEYVFSAKNFRPGQVENAVRIPLESENAPQILNIQKRIQKPTPENISIAKKQAEALREEAVDATRIGPFPKTYEEAKSKYADLINSLQLDKEIASKEKYLGTQKIADDDLRALFTRMGDRSVEAAHNLSGELQRAADNLANAKAAFAATVKREGMSLSAIQDFAAARRAEQKANDLLALADSVNFGKELKDQALIPETLKELYRRKTEKVQDLRLLGPQSN